MSENPTIPVLAERRTLFLSHANPSDNEFTRWLALRLAGEGYEVWCDLTKLLGGSNWWTDIEHALRQKTRKFVFVVSKTSNHADGALKELAVADGVKRLLNDSEFIIPVKIDDTPFRDHNIYINGLNALNFTQGWAAGLAELLRTLQEQGVPRDNKSGPGVVAAWWNDHQLNRELVRSETQTHLTNWFRIRSMPESLWVWRMPGDSRPPKDMRWPAYHYRDRLVSFASAKDLTGTTTSPTGGRGIQVAYSLDDDPPREVGLDRSELRMVVRQLLRKAWDKVAEQRNLPMYELSSNRRTLWFPAGSVSPNGVPFIGIDGKRADRQLYGFKSVGPKGTKYKRFYHYGVEAQPVIYPELVFALKSHVIFTLDGATPHKDVKYQHRARRSQCKRWWNDRWRDLLLAATASLANGKDQIELPLCPTDLPLLDVRPIELISPKSYLDAHVKEPSDEQLDSGDSETEELEEAGETESVSSGEEPFAATGTAVETNE